MQYTHPSPQTDTNSRPRRLVSTVAAVTFVALCVYQIWNAEEDESALIDRALPALALLARGDADGLSALLSPPCFFNSAVFENQSTLRDHLAHLFTPIVEPQRSVGANLRAAIPQAPESLSQEATTAAADLARGDIPALARQLQRLRRLNAQPDFDLRAKTRIVMTRAIDEQTEFKKSHGPPASLAGASNVRLDVSIDGYSTKTRHLVYFYFAKDLEDSDGGGRRFTLRGITLR